MYEFFDHTADLGFRVTAPDLASTFADAARCLYAAMTEAPDAILPTVHVRIEISGTDREYLLFDWLRELLTRFEADGMLYSRFDVDVWEGGLTADIYGEPIDPARHELSREVKAITYHGLKVEKTVDGWLAEVIVDI